SRRVSFSQSWLKDAFTLRRAAKSTFTACCTSIQCWRPLEETLRCTRELLPSHHLELVIGLAVRPLVFVSHGGSLLYKGFATRTLSEFGREPLLLFFQVSTKRGASSHLGRLLLGHATATQPATKNGCCGHACRHSVGDDVVACRLVLERTMLYVLGLAFLE